MTNRADGMTYAPSGSPAPVVSPSEFRVGAAHLDHGHLFGMCDGLAQAGAEIAWFYDPDPKRVASFQRRFPTARAARSLDEILDDDRVALVAGAAIPSDRGPLGCRVLAAGKHYFTDKTPFTSQVQLDDARAAVATNNRRCLVYFSERLHSECAVHAGRLVRDGAIGKVIQVLGLGPHRLNAPARPSWFFERERYGGILCDIGSHQFEQYLFYSGARSVRVAHAAVGNYANGAFPELEDYGEATLVGDNGTTNHVRVDWFTPDGLSTWGDGRTIILGTEGTIELRKYVDIARSATPDHLYVADAHGEHHIEVAGTVGYPFFGEAILDCLNGTERAMTQDHIFAAAELCLKAQAAAVNLTPEALRG
jgi:predicted dehydrogenase